MQRIRFTTFGATSAGGSFSPGDIMRCDDALARHLVEEARCAVYADAQPKTESAEEPARPVVRRRRSSGA